MNFMKSKSTNSKSKPVNRKISLLQLVGLSIAFFGSIRNVPQVATAGYSAIMWMIISLVIFVVPMAFIAAELATGWSKKGGPEVWVREAFGKKWGFLVSWLLWVQMFFGMVIIAVGFAVMFAFVIGDPMITTAWGNGATVPVLVDGSMKEIATSNFGAKYSLSTDPIYLLLMTIVIYWIITGLNIYSKKVGKSLVNIGAIIGIYIPFIFLTLFSIIFIGQKAGSGELADIPFFPPPSEGIIPPNASGLQLFSQIMWIFIGLEIASTRANEIDNPKKNFSLGLLIVLVLMVVFNLGAGLLFAAIVPANDINLANAVITPFQIITKYWHAEWLTNVFALLMAFGMFTQLNSWILGPSNAMYASATKGTMPLVFHKKTKKDVPITFVLIQAAAVTVFASLYAGLTIAGAGNVFGILLNQTIILYCIAYVLMIAAFVKLKYSKPNVVRGFTVPGKKIGAWITSVLAIIGVVMAIVMTFFQQQQTITMLIVQDVVIYVGLTAALVAIPLLLSLTKKFKNGSWITDEEKNEMTLEQDEEKTLNTLNEEQAISNINQVKPNDMINNNE